MPRRAPRPPRASQVGALVACALSAALASGCAHVAPPATSAAPPSVESEAWRVSIALDTAPVGDTPTASRAVVTVAARGRFHLNDDYPIHFIPTAQPGLEFARARIDKTDGISTSECGDEASKGHACAARVPVEFVRRGAPSTIAATIPVGAVGGQLAFSACDDERCLIEKVTVATSGSNGSK